MTTERAVMLVKKVTYFGEFGYLNSSCIRKNYWDIDRLKPLSATVVLY